MSTPITRDENFRKQYETSPRPDPELERLLSGGPESARMPVSTQPLVPAGTTWLPPLKR